MLQVYGPFAPNVVVTSPELIRYEKVNITSSLASYTFAAHAQIYPDADSACTMACSVMQAGAHAQFSKTSNSIPPFIFPSGQRV